MTKIITRPRAAGTTPARLNELSALDWWRGEPRLDPIAVATLRTTLDRLHLLLFPQWPAAVRGDAAAAVSIGLYVVADPTSPLWLVDCTGSALLLSAQDGSDEAARVLGHLRRRHGFRHHAAPEL
jgi:hypothetical protein